MPPPLTFVEIRDYLQVDHGNVSDTMKKNRVRAIMRHATEISSGSPFCVRAGLRDAASCLEQRCNSSKAHWSWRWSRAFGSRRTISSASLRTCSGVMASRMPPWDVRFVPVNPRPASPRPISVLPREGRIWWPPAHPCLYPSQSPYRPIPQAAFGFGHIHGLACPPRPPTLPNPSPVNQKTPWERASPRGMVPPSVVLNSP